MIKVAIVGFGNIGSGTAYALEVSREGLKKLLGEEIRLAYVVDIADLSHTPYSDIVTSDFSVVENDPEVSIVVETIGGQRVAYDYTRRALLAGKSVVTSNKELVSEKGSELVQIAQEKGVHYLFEASVGGGIPILQPLVQCLAANRIEEISGILNGTTNYILTRMFTQNASFETALAEAQSLGYAERDPSADVDGIDACRKIAILADLAFGVNVPPAKVYTEGIRGITAADTEFAKMAGCAVKLLGRAVRRSDGKAYVLVAPHFIDLDRPIASVAGVYNGISVVGDLVGETMFYGSGAGKLPTASAVVGDILYAAGLGKTAAQFVWHEGEDIVAPIGEMELSFFIRTAAADAQAVLAAFPGAQKIGESAGFAGFLTPVLAHAQVMQTVEALKAQGVEVFSLIRKM